MQSLRSILQKIADAAWVPQNTPLHIQKQVTRGIQAALHICIIFPRECLYRIVIWSSSNFTEIALLHCYSPEICSITSDSPGGLLVYTQRCTYNPCSISILDVVVVLDLSLNVRTITHNLLSEIHAYSNRPYVIIFSKIPYSKICLWSERFVSRRSIWIK